MSFTTKFIIHLKYWSVFWLKENITILKLKHFSVQQCKTVLYNCLLLSPLCQYMIYFLSYYSIEARLAFHIIKGREALPPWGHHNLKPYLRVSLRPNALMVVRHLQWFVLASTLLVKGCEFKSHTQTTEEP